MLETGQADQGFHGHSDDQDVDRGCGSADDAEDDIRNYGNRNHGRRNAQAGNEHLSGKPQYLFHQRPLQMHAAGRKVLTRLSLTAWKNQWWPLTIRKQRQTDEVVQDGDDRSFDGALWIDDVDDRKPELEPDDLARKLEAAENK